jgi:CRP-like cAMP-binding protein
MASSGGLSSLQETFSSGEVIFSEDDLTRDLYVLLKGKVEVIHRGIQLSILDKNGIFFGEMAMLSSEPRSATLRALTDSVMLKVPPEKLPLLLQNMPDLAMRMAKNLASTVRRLNKDLKESWESVELVKLLKEEAEVAPTGMISETLPKLFLEVKQKQHESMLDVTLSYLKSNLFIQPFISAMESTLTPFSDYAVKAEQDESSDEVVAEKICGIDFTGATSGTFLFMAKNKALSEIGEKLFSDKVTETLENDTLLELARGTISAVKVSAPSLGLEMTTPEILEGFTLPGSDLLGIKLKTNAGFSCWIHLNR